MLDFRAVLPSKLKIAGNRFRLAGGRGDIGATLIRNLAGIFRRPESEHKNVNETYLEHKFGLDTSGLVRSPLLTPDGSPYYGSAPSLFNAIMRSLSINLANATFIDLGSGKGRALFLAAGLPFVVSSEWKLCLTCIESPSKMPNASVDCFRGVRPSI